MTDVPQILRIRMNHSNAGFFAYLTFALNQLRYAEERRLHPVIDFGPVTGRDAVSTDDRNAFYDPEHGENTWDYYFEPPAGDRACDLDARIADPNDSLTADNVVLLDDEALWALHLRDPASVYPYPYGRWASMADESSPEAWYAEQRQRMRTLLDRYVRVKPHVRAHVDAFREEHLTGRPVLGVHLRGTDKGNRDPKTGRVVASVAPERLTRIVPPEEYFPSIDAYLEAHPEAAVFLATDQQEFVGILAQRYGDRLVTRSGRRGTGRGIGSNPFQQRDGGGYRKGEEVLVDCLLLSGCDFLLKCTSAVGEFALAWNEKLRGFDLNHHTPGSHPWRTRLRQRSLRRKADGGASRAGFVVNYFCTDAEGSARETLRDATALSLRLLRDHPRVGVVLLSDGSPAPDAELRQRCDALGVEYAHYGRATRFTESYNLGWRSLAEDFDTVALMANDVIPHPPESLDRLLDQLDADPEIGCVFPYLATPRRSVDETQRPGFGKRAKTTCEPASMTLNLNVFRREALDRAGGLDEAYLHGYSEPLLILRLRGAGHRVVLVGDTHAYHYDQLTKQLGVSELTPRVHAEDTARWFREHPTHATRRGIANLDLSRWPFATTRRAALLWWLCGMRIPRRRALRRFALWIEPRLTRYPARFGRAPWARRKRRR